MTAPVDQPVDPTAGPPVDSGLRADLVLEGGGVKGLGLVGAVEALAGAGYRFPRVAGSSAGALVAAFVAALQRDGQPLDRLGELARGLDYRRLRDRGLLGRLPALRPVADVLSLVLENGIYEGDSLRDWLAEALADLGVRTFADLRVAEAPDAAEAAGTLPQHRYTLVVTATDLTRRRLVRLPWDYPRYGLDPDEQLVADAVRASTAIPFYYQPVVLPGGGERSTAPSATLVDGGVLSNFPIALFDRTDGRPPHWPTFGVRLSARPGEAPTPPVRGPVSLARALVATLLEAADAEHLDDPCVQARSIFVEAPDVSPIDFALPPGRQEQLLSAGRAAAEEFLAGWDWPRYLARCREFEQEGMTAGQAGGES